MTLPEQGTSGAANVPESRAAMRVRDSRATLAWVVEAVARAVRAGRDGRSLRAHFEGVLEEALGVPRVRLREHPLPYAAPIAGAPESIRRIAIHVPTRHGTPPVVLEATLHAHAPLDGWDSHLFGVAAQLASLVLEVERGRADVRSLRGGARAGRSPPRRRSSARARRWPHSARTSPAWPKPTSSCLIEGESGTGKELVARQLHQLSHRSHGPFVAVNCAAIVESLLEAELFGIEDRTATGVRGRRGKFEHADGGTLVSRRGVGPRARGAGQAAARDPGTHRRTRRRATASARSIRGSSWRPTGACGSWCRPGSFGRTCSTGSPASSCTCRR